MILMVLSSWSEEDVMFTMSLNYHRTDDSTIANKIEQIAGHVDEPDMDKIKHRLFDLTEKHSDILFSKIIRCFKRVKPERFYPKDITELLKVSLEECVRDYLDVFYVLQLEYNKLDKQIKKTEVKMMKKCGPLWNEGMNNG